MYAWERVKYIECTINRLFDFLGVKRTSWSPAADDAQKTKTQISQVCC